MLHEVPREQLNDLRPLAAKLVDQGMAQAVLAGTRPGVALVNSLESPTSLCLFAPEGAFVWSYLAGDPLGPAFHKELNRWLFERYGPENGIAFTLLVCDHPDWEEALPAILSPRSVIPDRRLHYECHEAPAQGWQESVPSGYKIRSLDRDLLQSDVVMHEKVTQWLVSNFGSQEIFVETAFGAVAIHDSHVVAWCLPDSIGTSRADIGVETLAEHQQRGLAHACTCLTLEQAFARGLSTVGWHCHVINEASNKTAQKAGFRRCYEYSVYAVHFDSAKHAELAGVVGDEYVEQANECLQQGDYPEAHALYTRLLGFHQPSDPEVFLNAARAAAQVGSIEDAFRLLASGNALGEGFDGETLAAAEFKILKKNPRWEAICLHLSNRSDHSAEIDMDKRFAERRT